MGYSPAAAPRRRMCYNQAVAFWSVRVTYQRDQLLSRVTKPARYTDAEWNAVHKGRREGAPHPGPLPQGEGGKPAVLFALAYPDVYEVGMSHLGLRILYHVLNDHPRYAAERVFSPWPDMEQALRAAGQPLTTLESGTPLSQVDVVGVSVPYELTCTNVLNLLDLGGIPVRATARGDEAPIVLAGGPAVANPEPLADFVDAFFVGEAEDGILEIAAALAATKGQPRAARLAALAAVKGVYVPSLYGTVEQGGILCPTPRAGAPALVERRLVDLEAAPYPTRPIVPYLETVHDRVTLEIMRGCTRGCRFCQAGMAYRPVRERSVDTCAALAREAIDSTGYDEISLLAFNSADYSRIGELADRLLEQHRGEMVSVGMPSLRIDTFSVELAQRLQEVRKSGLTFAPEAGTQRLRDVINKNVTETDLFAAARAAFEAGWFHLKLYFMIGLPTETDEDVAGIADLVRRLLEFGREVAGKERRGRLRLAVSVNPFVPKAHTPFQWDPLCPPEELRRRIGLLRDHMPHKGVDLSVNRPELTALEAVLSRGDRSLGAVLESAWQAGCRFDAWAEQLRLDLWQQAFEAQGQSAEALATRALTPGQPLPWDHISYGVSRRYLEAERQAALAAACTPDCRFEGCTLCGACPEAAAAG